MAKIGKSKYPTQEIGEDYIIGSDVENHNRRGGVTMESYFKYLKQKCLEDGEVTLEMQGNLLIMKPKIMTKREQAIEQVNKLLLEKFDFIEETDLPSMEDHSLLSDIGIDSIDVWELEMEFEQLLNCTINESSTVRTYGELVTMYENNLNL